MKTISLNRTMNVTFKQVQRLPVLTPAMMAGEPAPHASHHPTRAPLEAHPETRATTPPAPARQLPRPRADQCAGEQALFAILGLTALFCVGQALALMIAWSPDLPSFAAWVSQLLA